MMWNIGSVYSPHLDLKRAFSTSAAALIQPLIKQSTDRILGVGWITHAVIILLFFRTGLWIERYQSETRSSCEVCFGPGLPGDPLASGRPRVVYAGRCAPSSPLYITSALPPGGEGPLPHHPSVTEAVTLLSNGPNGLDDWHRAHSIFLSPPPSLPHFLFCWFPRSTLSRF